MLCVHCRVCLVVTLATIMADKSWSRLRVRLLRSRLRADSTARHLRASCTIHVYLGTLVTYFHTLAVTLALALATRTRQSLSLCLLGARPTCAPSRRRCGGCIGRTATTTTTTEDGQGRRYFFSSARFQHGEPRGGHASRRKSTSTCRSSSAP